MVKNMIKKQIKDKDVENVEVVKDVRVRQWPKVVVGVVVLLVAASGWVYASYFKPLTKVFLSLEKTFESHSAEAKYELKEGNFSVVTKLSDKIGEGEMSSVVVSGEGFKAEGRVGKTDLFVQADISQVGSLTESLASMDPSLVKKQSYLELIRMITGQTWMHWDLPDKWWNSEENVETKWSEMSKKEEIKAWWNIYKVVKVNKYERGVEINGKRYDRVVLGFRKAGLLALIEEMKKQDVDLKLSQINAMKKVVESSNDWDKDLVVYLIDSEGRLAEVDMKMPKIEEEVLNDSVKEGVKENAGLSGFVNGFGLNLGGALNKNKEEKLVSLGKITVSGYGLPTNVAMPESRIEWESWSKRALEDYRPLIMQVMEAMMQPAPVE